MKLKILSQFSRFGSVVILAVVVFGCEGSNDENSTAVSLSLPDRQILALDNSRIVAGITINNGSLQEFIVEPGQTAIDVSVNGIRLNENNSIQLLWSEFYNDIKIELAIQNQEFFGSGNVVIDAEYNIDMFDYDLDGVANYDERIGGSCVWSPIEECLSPGVLDLPEDSDVATPTDVASVGGGDNMLLNGDFSDGGDLYFTNIGTQYVVDGILCTDVPPNETAFQREVVEHQRSFDLDSGTYAIEFDYRSTHANKSIRTSLYQLATAEQPHYDRDAGRTKLEWQRYRSVFVNPGFLGGISVAISAVQDSTEAVTYCFDNYIFYKEL